MTFHGISSKSCKIICVTFVTLLFFSNVLIFVYVLLENLVTFEQKCRRSKKKKHFVKNKKLNSDLSPKIPQDLHTYFERP